VLKTFILAGALALAQTGHSDHSEGHENGRHDDHPHTHEAVDATNPAKPGAALARTNAIEAALAAGGAPVVVDVLGVVCDFCAKAMNKTFGKRAEVAAVYVDLDDKTLNLVLKADASMSDETIRKLVTKAGYRAADIRRGEAALGAADAGEGGARAASPS